MQPTGCFSICIHEGTQPFTLGDPKLISRILCVCRSQLLAT